MAATQQEDRTVALVEALRARCDKVISLVGAGGKTTIMSRLAKELASLEARVVLTTTTRIFIPDPSEVGTTIISDQLGRLLNEARQGFQRQSVVAVGTGIDKAGKLQGLPADWVTEMMRVADTVIVEADGAAEKPFKAPADHEPVIPVASTLVVAVAGVDCIGQALDAEHVHRPERIAAITGLAPGSVIGPGAVAQVLLHPQGVAKGAPPGARIAYFLNKVDDRARLEEARQTAHLLVEGGADLVILGRARSSDPVVEVITSAA